MDVVGSGASGYGAGIGGVGDYSDPRDDAGTIVVDSGTVHATGGDYAAGIGAGYEGTFTAVIVNGGTVEATGGYEGAGIGGSYDGTGGAVTVNGGTVTATSGDYAAAVGGGCYGKAGSLTVTGGSLTAIGTEGSSGIGDGYYINEYTDGVSQSTVDISGGTVTASGGDYSAGVGGAEYSPGSAVTVSGGSLTATGGEYGAGIGSGYDNGYYTGSSGTSGSLTVTGGAVTATGGTDSAGIGGATDSPGAAVQIASPAQVTAINTGSSVSAIGGGGSDVSSNVVRQRASTRPAAPARAARHVGTARAKLPQIRPAVVTDDFGSLSNGGTLTIPTAAQLIIPDGVTATNSGTLELGGTLSGLGTVHNTGSVVTATLGGTVTDHGTGPAGTALLVENDNYHLTFNTEGATSTTPDDLYVYAATVSDSDQSLPPAPTHGGDTFSGWYTSPSGGTHVTDTTNLPVTAFDTDGPDAETLYAHYTAAEGLYTSHSPASRVLDTRRGIGAAQHKIGPNSSLILTVPNLPANTAAVKLNLTGVGFGGARSTYVSACPAATSAVNCVHSSALNAYRADPVANEITVPVAADGKIRFVNRAGSIDLVADVTGYFSSRYQASGPTRAYDSRNTGSGGPIGANSSRVVPLTNVPEGTGAVVVNITAVGLTGAGSTYVSACPGEEPAADCSHTSVLNPVGSQPVANEVTLPVSRAGTVRLYNRTGSVNVVLDVEGYLSPDFNSSGAFYRAFDSRTGSGTTDAPITADSSRVITLAGLPSDTTAVTLNLTAVGLTGSTSSYLTACATSASNATCARTSTINLHNGSAVPNAITVPVDADHSFRIYNRSGSVNVVGDVSGVTTG